MTAGQLLDQLETSGLIDDAVLAKVRKQIESSDKPVKPQSILNLLIKKNLLTEPQAKQLLKQEPATSEVQDSGEEELGLAEPEPVEPEELEPLEPEPVEPEPMESEAIEPEPIKPDALEPLESEPIAKEAESLEADPIDMNDSFGTEPVGGYDEPFPESGTTEPQTSGLGFKGKIDKSDQWATKWLYIGFGILGTLMIAGAVLYIATMGVAAEDQYEAAVESLEKLAYQDAAAKFDEYIEANPKHKYVPQAKARRVQAMLRTTYSARNWSETIQRAQTLLPPIVEEENNKVDIIRDDLAIMLPNSLLSITDAGKKAEELPDLEKNLATAMEFKTVIDNPVYIPTSQRNKPTTAAALDKIENNIKNIQDQIDKEKEYNLVKVQVRKLGDEGQTDEAFAAYTKMIRRYPDLAARTELREIMQGISLSEQKLVKPASTDFATYQDARPSPIQSTVVLASKSGSPVDNLKGEIFNFLADGSVYGIEGDSGTMLWRMFVGYQTHIQPVLLNLDHLLVSDQQHHDLISVDRATGKILWRAEIGEPFLAPVFADGPIVLTTRSGKVIQFDRDSGQPIAAVQLPQAASVPAHVDQTDPYIYQIGQYSNLYILSAQDLSCKEVFYLGHYKNSISVPLQTWSGYLLVAVNRGDGCDLHILKPTQKGLGFERAQVMNQITDGPVSTPLQRFRRWMLMTADNGDVRILELLPSDESSPIRTYTSDRFDNSGGQSANLLTSGSNLWISGLGISRFRVRSQGKFEREDIVDHADAFLTPLTKIDDYIFHVSRRYGSGMLSASVVEAESLKSIWRTDFGGQVVGAPQPSGNEVLAVSNQGDLFRIGSQELQKNYAESVAKSSTVVEDLKFDALVPLENGQFACTGPQPQEDFVFVQPQNNRIKLLRLSPPANKLACPPVSIGKHLIVPSAKGQIARIDPNSGLVVGTPFQPPITPGTETEWFRPSLIDDDKFAIAKGDGVNNSDVSALYLLSAANENALKQLGSLASDKPFKSGLANDGKSIFAVTESDTSDYLVLIPIADSLEVKQKSALPGRVVAGPWSVAGGILVKMDSDQVMFFSQDLSEKWSLDIANDQFAGPPAMSEDLLQLSFRSGKLKYINPQDGSVVKDIDLGEPIASPPTEIGSATVINGMDGTVHLVDLSQASEGN